ncbi:hypothetical protein BD309DRAFT_1029900 [Dichomitus squalens]|nr:hypothetical protein BD309DRAFT_1029900 [Dichomitus squalens]
MGTEYKGCRTIADVGTKGAILVINLDSTPPSELTIDYVITRLLNAESPQLSLNPPHLEIEAALAAHTKLRTPLERITCFKCSKKGHYQRDCPGSATEGANVAFLANLPRPDEEDEIIAW